MRKSWDHYFMDLAYTVATRATCPRLHVGAVLVKNKKVMGTGYNGAPAGVPSCDDEGCMIVHTHHIDENGKVISKDHCIRTVHAEQNLLLFTDQDDRAGATVYVTDQPCWNCAKQLANSGIAEVVYHRPYIKDQEVVKQLFEQKGIIFRELTDYTR
jgi:dCMP deaminase